MFARFRDENALMDPGFVMPEVLQLPVTYPGAGFDAGAQNTCFTTTLTDGRTLAWSEYGHRHGYPILYMHREGGSRLEAGLLHEAAKAAGFRLIAVDRPGLGRSDFIAVNNPGLLTDDYHQLINLLGLSRVALFSWGSGSRFALAMAVRFPERISFLNLMAPHERGCKLAQHRVFSAPLKLALRLLLTVRTLRVSRDHKHYLQRWREHMCYADRKQIDDPEVGALLASIAREASCQGAAGLTQDIWLGLTAAESARDEVTSQALPMPVHIWNGLADVVSRSPVPYPGEDGGTASVPDVGVVRHWVRRQGHLFVRQAAADIFNVARKTVGINPAVGDLLRR